MKSFATAAALLAAITISSAAPTPQAAPATLPVGQEIIILQQLSRDDTANTATGIVDKTSVVGDTNKIVEAAVSAAGPTPWCAGFSDAAATKVVKNVNFQKDGIFNSVRSASYGDEAVLVASYWCANTRPEVEAFVAKQAAAAASPAPVDNGAATYNYNNYNSAPASATSTYAASTTTSTAWAHASASATTVRVQIETAPDTFVQADLPANVGLQSTVGTQLADGAITVSVVDSTKGDCDFVSADGQVVDFSARELKAVAKFVCEA